MLFVATAAVGWLVAAAALNRRGQTPAGALLGYRRINRRSGDPVRFAHRHHHDTVTITA